MNEDIVISGPTATWRMPPTVGDLGGTYTGTFEFRTFLDPIRILQAGREYRELLGGLAIQADDLEVKLAQILIQLKYRIVKAPPFWTSTEPESGMAGNIGDMNIIGMIFDAATRAEDLFKDKIEKEKEAALSRTIRAGESLLEKKGSENESL